MQTINKFDIFLADLNPQRGTEPGKVRPVVIVQSDLLNQAGHPSTLICPITTNVEPSAHILRVRINSKGSGLKKASDILVDQLRAIDNRRLKKRVGKLSVKEREHVLKNMSILLLE